jgi:glycosyltransferase involved in cell wall biosynthesis
MSVVIPVANEPRYLELLPEALKSIHANKYWPDEIVIVLDGFNRPLAYNRGAVEVPITEQYLIARGGVPNAFNTGVEVARNQAVFMMGCDDLLKEECIARAWLEYTRWNQKDAFYWLDVEYEDGETQSLPCGHALVTKKFWRWVGGYSIYTAQGACDAALCSVLLKHHPELLVHVDTPNGPQFICRRSLDSYTGRSQKWQGVILETRSILTDTWQPNGSLGKQEAAAV